MYKKSKVNPNIKKVEAVEEFLARGGKIDKVAEGDSYKRKTRKSFTVDAQKLLDNCKNEAEEKSLIEFLKSQGVNVED